MANSPAPFSDIGKKAKDLLNKGYNFDHKFTLTMLSDAGMALTATGVKRDQHFVGDISTQYKSGCTTVDVKVDSGSNVSTTVTVNEIFPCTKAALSFKIPDHKSGKASTTVTVTGIFPCTKAVLSFKIPDHKSGKLDVRYIHPHASINSSIGLTPTPLLELAATIGSKELGFGGEIAFDTASSSLTKYNAGIGLFKPDFSAALILEDKGETLKASYVHLVNPINGTAVAAELTHRFSTYQNSFTFGSSHSLDPFTMVKTRFSDNGKLAVLCQREWRPKSLVTFSAEYDPKAVSSASRFGLALALKP
ncbi:PREDICTED: mitochondrial outer membrane protein porin 4 isoform X1 [Nelumbo nucifera]|uniref:Mitochondrial outer membrane protein porin 4 isoform X1 n=1 Tax=Nelumbo nucifera TaxID=4432 RepID=A0A1U8ADJ4_NELNU|nr:PREDICTED: mitochondrial outer membrane protein porin 4 isoform X1 [Nelumbo nucifera]